MLHSPKVVWDNIKSIPSDIKHIWKTEYDPVSSLFEDPDLHSVVARVSALALFALALGIGGFAGSMAPVSIGMTLGLLSVSAAISFMAHELFALGINLGAGAEGKELAKGTIIGLLCQGIQHIKSKAQSNKSYEAA